MISSLRLIDLVFLSVLLASMLSIAGAEDSLACDTDGEFFHNTENCNTYYVCVHGQKVLMPCNTGLVFSLQETTCVPEDHDLNDCEPSSNADDPLSCDTDGEFFHNNENCNTYYVCDHGQKTLMPCITGLVFSLQGKTCVQKGTEGLDDCVEVTEPLTIEEQCSNGASIIPHPTKCQLYYNCSLPRPVFYSPIGPIHRYLDECTYAQLLSTDTLQCENPEDVKCEDREELLDACSYMRFQCLGSSHCIPCLVGSCIDRPDGRNPNDKRLWSPYYTICEKERTARDPVTGALGQTCSKDAAGMTQLFHPIRNMCVPVDQIPKEHGGTMP